jgi:hypothetical protein
MLRLQRNAPHEDCFQFETELITTCLRALCDETLRLLMNSVEVSTELNVMNIITAMEANTNKLVGS